MAIKNVHGHGTTSVLGASGGQEVQSAPIAFPQTMGPANHQGTNSKPGGGLPGGRSGGKKSSHPQAPNKSVSPILKG